MSKVSSPKKVDFFEDFDQTPIIEWFSKNKQMILGGLGSLLAVLLILYYVLSSRATQAENDFSAAEVAFQHVQENQDINENLALLYTLLDRRPELHAKYDAALAQILLIKQEPIVAAPYAERVFKRVEGDGLDFYESYGRNSIVIESGDYKTGYDNAKALKTQMDESATKNFGNLLYGYNLIRLATLEQLLGYKQEELKTWDQLLNFSAFSEVNQLFMDGRISLQDYIAARKQAFR